MSKVLIATYGIRSKGEGVGKLVDALRDDYDEIRVYHHPVRHFWHAWNWDTVLSDSVGVLNIAGRYNEPIDVLGHSYGALILLRAAWLGMRIENAYFLGAAMSSDQEPYHLLPIRNIINYHNVDDRALRLGSWIPQHPFGRMGIDGYRGKPAVPHLRDYSMRMGKGLFRHSGYFDPENIYRLRKSMRSGRPIE